MNADGRGLENVTALLFAATLDHALVKPLVEQAELWEAVPEKEIQALSAGMGADPVLAAECRRLFVAECRLSSEPHGALAAWLGFALALAQEPQAADAFSNLVRGFRNPACKEETEHEHYWLALNCLQLYGEASARQVAATFPFPDDKLSDENLIWDDLELLLTVHGSADAELRRQVAAEAERLLNHPEFAKECVEVACLAFAAAAPERALEFVPPHLERCEDKHRIKKVLKALRKGAPIGRILLPPWQEQAEEAAVNILEVVESWREIEADQNEDDEEWVPAEDVDDDETVDPSVPLPDPPRSRATDPYAPCPCGSGKNYKWCCRAADRKKEEAAGGGW